MALERSARDQVIGQKRRILILRVFLHMLAFPSSIERVSSADLVRARHLQLKPRSQNSSCGVLHTHSFVISRASDISKLALCVEASGPHDFAVHEQARSPSALPTSTASRLTFVTIAKCAALGRDDERFRFDLGKWRSGKFLEMGLDEGNQIESLQQIQRERTTGSPASIWQQN
jgi:hypothetical protein